MTRPKLHHHHRRHSRPRSVSLSSSSPSPPPLRHSSPQNSPLPLHSPKDKRRSFSTGKHLKVPIRGPLPNFASRSGDDPLWDEINDGFSTQYGASASSVASVSVNEPRFLGRGSVTTETEAEGRRRGTPDVWQRSINDLADGVQVKSNSHTRDLLTTQTNSRRSYSPMTLLPFRLGFARPLTFNVKGCKISIVLGVNVTRRKCENALVLLGVALSIKVLGRQWREKALAAEIGLLSGLTILFASFRTQQSSYRCFANTGRLHPSPAIYPFHSSTKTPNLKERTSYMMDRGSTPVLRKEDPKRAGTTGPELVTGEDDRLDIGGRGCIWGTEEREYRDCLDDGLIFALLLGPLVAAALLHSALWQLSTFSLSPLPKEWNIELPLVLSSTPINQGLGTVPSEKLNTNTTRALSALATSRRNLVQLFTLCSFVLLVHLLRSTQLEAKISPAFSHSTTSFSYADDINRFQTQHSSGRGTYWLRKGEWRRTRSVVGFAFLVTLSCLGVKGLTALIGRGVWSDMSSSDIVLATLFYQFSIYVCVRLARKGFTLGELAVVCCAATAMIMEVINLTRMKMGLFRTPYIKTYRLPTPLLIFQLALVPGSLLNGFLLSPLLYLSRNLAQKPAHRLRLPHEKPVHRRLLALGFYAGSALVCGGIVGVWAQWCLEWRNPWKWGFVCLLEGKHSWTRPALIGYWSVLALISIAAWERQLARAHRHRQYSVPGLAATRGEVSHIKQLSIPTSPKQKIDDIAASSNGQGKSSGVATQMMNAADQRLPILSVNARRKSFHALAVVMFVPGIAIDPVFTHLSFSVAFAAFTFAEYIRYFALWPFGVKVHLFLNEFIDHKDSGTAILSHFYLLAGCACPLWFEGPIEILSYFGVLALGVGDALASIVGRRFGRLRWCTAFGKTVEGSVAFFMSVLLFSTLLWMLGIVNSFKPGPYIITVALSTLLEAFSAQNDNLILPMFGWAIGILLGL
ncbi:hypothetical protein L204_102279 [Cryptococcus depauperatus]